MDGKGKRQARQEEDPSTPTDHKEIERERERLSPTKERPTIHSNNLLHIRPTLQSSHN